MTEQAEDPGVDALVFEITVCAFAVKPDGYLVNGSAADATIGFAIRTDKPPDGLTDEQVMAVVTRPMAQALAAIIDTFRHMGYVSLGQVDDPVKPRATPTGRVTRTPPVRIVHPAPGDSGRPS